MRYNPGSYYNLVTTFTDIPFNWKAATQREIAYPDVDLYLRTNTFTRLEAAANLSMAFKLASYIVAGATMGAAILFPHIGVPLLIAKAAAWTGVGFNAAEFILAGIASALSPHYKGISPHNPVWSPTNVLRGPWTGIAPLPVVGVKSTRAKFAETSLN